MRLGRARQNDGVSFWCRPCLRAQPPVKYRQAHVEVTQTDRSAVLPDKVLSRLDIAGLRVQVPRHYAAGHRIRPKCPATLEPPVIGHVMVRAEFIELVVTKPCGNSVWLSGTSAPHRERSGRMAPVGAIVANARARDRVAGAAS